MLQKAPKESQASIINLAIEKAFQSVERFAERSEEPLSHDDKEQSDELPDYLNGISPEVLQTIKSHRHRFAYLKILKLLFETPFLTGQELKARKGGILGPGIKNRAADNRIIELKEYVSSVPGRQLIENTTNHKGKYKEKGYFRPDVVGALDA
jgi:hypothetical protein